jgi:ligand-binding sensor domain-containing protein
VSGTDIAEYREKSITDFAAVEEAEPETAHPGWTSWSSFRSVRALALAPGSRRRWLATWGGVLCWDLETRQVFRYRSEHGLAVNPVSCLCVDADERPWVGHPEGGLSFLDGGRWRVYRDLPEEPIRAACGAAAGPGVWVAGAGGVSFVPGPDQPPQPVPQENGEATGALALLADGNGLLLGSPLGLFRLGLDTPPAALARETIPACTALARDARQRIWVGTPDAVYRLENGQESTPAGPFRPGPDEPAGRVLGLAADPVQLWVLTAAGLARVSDDRWRPVPWPDEAEAPPAPRAIAASQEETYLWVGSDRLLAGVWGSGSEKAHWDLKRLPLKRDDGLNNLGRCAAPQGRDGRVWVGTAGGLLTFGPGREWSLDLEEVDVRAVCPAADGTLWVLAWPAGVVCRPAGGGPFFDRLALAGLPVALALGQDGNPYAVTEGGLWQLSPGPPRAVEREVPAFARCLAQTPDRTWWLGTAQGVYQLAPGAGWRLAGERRGPTQAEVHALAVINGALWAATAAGLWERRGGGWLPHATDTPGNLPAVWALAPAGTAEKLWVGRADGVVRYDIRDCRVELIYTPPESGLAGRRATALVESAGALWVVTEAGVCSRRLA